jgi:hypothetical protein
MKMLKRAGLVVIAVALVAGLGACKKGTVWRIEGAKFPDPKVDKFVIMPVDLHMPGNKLAMATALFGGVVGYFGANAISLQPIKPALEAVGLGNLSWFLAHGIYHYVSHHKSGDLAKSSYSEGGMLLKDAPDMAVKLITLVAEKLSLDFKPRYVVTAHLDSMGTMAGGKMLKYRVIGALYDSETKMVLACTWYTKTTANDDKVLIAEMATLAKQLMDVLLPKEA